MTEKLYQKAKDDAFRLLSYRERSCYELKTRLNKKGHSSDIIERVIERLTELNYLNDYRFASKWVKDRIKFKPRGPRMLRYELSKKGISSSLASKVINELVPEEVEIDLANRLAQKWLKRKRHQDNYLLKLKRYLNNKGFGIHIINKVIKINNI